MLKKRTLHDIPTTSPSNATSSMSEESAPPTKTGSPRSHGRCLGVLVEKAKTPTATRLTRGIHHGLQPKIQSRSRWMSIEANALMRSTNLREAGSVRRSKASGRVTQISHAAYRCSRRQSRFGKSMTETAPPRTPKRSAKFARVLLGCTPLPT